MPNDTINGRFNRRPEGDVMSQIGPTLQPRSLRSAYYMAGAVATREAGTVPER